MPSGSGFDSSIPPSSPAPTRWFGSGTAASSTMSSSFILSLALATAPLHLYEAVEPHMGTLVSIKLYARDEEQAKAVFRPAFDRIAQLDRIMSDYNPDSELNRICQTAVRHPVKVSDDLFTVLAASQKIAEESAGAFDI